MKNIKKFSAIMLLVLCLSVILSLSVSADTKYPRLVDGADLLTGTEEGELLKRLDEISEERNIDIAVVTADSYDGRGLEVFARDFYESAGYGRGEDYSGVMLFVSMNPRRYHILTAGDCIEMFGESDFDSLEDAFAEELSAGDYLDAFLGFASEAEYIIKYDGRLTPIWIFISLIVGALIAAFAIWKMMSKHKGVRSQRAAESYMLKNTFRLDRARDVFLFSTVSRVRKPESSSSGGGGGRSSSGRSYGGRSGSF